MQRIKIESPYSAAFTAGALLYHEMNSVLHLLMQPNYEELMKQEVQKNEFLNVASLSTRKRYVPELIRRFKAVPMSFWHDYISFSESAQRVALFYVVMKTYKIIWDFHINVTIPKWKSFDPTINSNDLNLRYNELAGIDEFVASWSQNTQGKVVSVYLHMLHQAGMRVEGKTDLKQPDLSDDEYLYYLKINEPWFLDACLLQAYQVESIKNLL